MGESGALTVCVIEKLSVRYAHAGFSSALVRTGSGVSCLICGLDGFRSLNCKQISDRLFIYRVEVISVVFEMRHETGF